MFKTPDFKIFTWLWNDYLKFVMICRNSLQKCKFLLPRIDIVKSWKELTISCLFKRFSSLWMHALHSINPTSPVLYDELVTRSTCKSKQSSFVLQVFETILYFLRLYSYFSLRAPPNNKLSCIISTGNIYV